MTTPNLHADTGEGGLSKLTDDDYFAALGQFPGAVDGAGNPIDDLFDDVVDAREVKRQQAAEAPVEPPVEQPIDDEPQGPQA